MPFQSEKQRRYLWANEPEIARDWTDTYGSRIRRDNGGGMGWADQGGMKNYLGEQPMVNAPQNWRAGPNTPPTELAYVTGPEKDLILQANMHGSLANGPNEGPSGIMSLDTQGDYTPDRSPGGTSGGGGGGDHEAENIATQQAARQKAVLTGKIQRDPLTGNWEAGRNLGRGEKVMGLGLGPGQGPTRGRTSGGMKNFLGNWAGSVGGAQLGGGLGSMLLGPWGMLLGSIFGQGVGRRSWKASQTDEKERLRDILMPKFMQNLGLFNKRTRDMSDFNKLGLGGTKPGTFDFDPNARISDTSFSTGQGIDGINLGDSSISETINDYDYKPRYRADDYNYKARDRTINDFDKFDTSTWFDTHPATGEAVMKPEARQIYKGSDPLNPRSIADSYEFMETDNPFKKEIWQRPHTFGQEHEWYGSNRPDDRLITDELFRDENLMA